MVFNERELKGKVRGYLQLVLAADIGSYRTYGQSALL
jgi:hypothetical protein